MEPTETPVIKAEGNKQSYARLLTTIDDAHLILHLRHVVEIWFKDNDILAFEELIRRYNASCAAQPTTPLPSSSSSS